MSLYKFNVSINFLETVVKLFDTYLLGRVHVVEATLVAVLASPAGNVLNFLMRAVGEVSRVLLSSFGVSRGHCDRYLYFVKICMGEM